MESPFYFVEFRGWGGWNNDQFKKYDSLLFFQANTGEGNKIRNQLLTRLTTGFIIIAFSSGLRCDTHNAGTANPLSFIFPPPDL